MTTTALLYLPVTALLITTATSQAPPTGYNNYTVGGGAGWLFNSTTNTSATNYTAWAAAQTFNLGDFLIFKTSSNQTVIQTYNETTFRSCVTDDASDTDTFIYAAGSSAFEEALTVAVPLTIVGPNYYFSDIDGGFQCQHGMAFEMSVNHGLGLPPSLNQPPPPPYIEPPGPDSAQSPPITINGGSDKQENAGSKGRGDALRLAFAVVLTVASAVLF